MASYAAPVDNALFLLRDVIGYERYGHLPAFSELTFDVVEAILREGGALAENVLHPLNRVGDKEGCARSQDGEVKTPSGFAAAFMAYRNGGWSGLTIPQDYGGQGLPYLLGTVLAEFFSSANMAFAMVPGLTTGAAAALLAYGDAAQKSRYLPYMAAGRWTGAMNLTEAHCGTDLGLIETKAIRNGDGSFSISGDKIFITAGEHDLAENIIHLVLARIDDAPKGVKGISLFLVPKILVADDGSLKERNRVSCTGIEHKMGIHGSPTCSMRYDGATGWLVGEENRGLNAMFVMMNEARLGVALQGLAQSEAAYQNALGYACERLQGRSLSGAKMPEQPADPLIVHPDVRRMLMTIKAFNEAARALLYWTALQSDIAHSSPDVTERANADGLLGLLTPVLKGVLTDTGFNNTVLAQQIFGGLGYIEESGMSQFVRDARIAMIYEGANGVQAMDLIGRKLPRDGGKALMVLLGEIGAFCQAHTDEPGLAPFVKPLREAAGHVQQATLWFMQNAAAKPDNAGAGAYDFMHLLGLTALGYMWARIAKTSLAHPNGDTEVRLVTGRFFMERIMPETAAHLARIVSGAETLMVLDAGQF